ncbi:site-specific integrase [Pseudenhygromyxa sp. WMMC2535]|uniref:tyrosine-type recombinase/integrase n=1 Tax=Pseudenhygromyxa sp. WMMC2535 TaxID=2712867 RepID=UPI001557C3AB|nr:site-specific integrase [Pseudenhygromyxa sp. WMMC2535]NVB41539.1 site-specific integrase [Pseudenhygromyxa sp. WMMC2535]
MTVKVRPYRRGGWEVDIVLTLDNGQTLRRRVKSPVASKSGSLRWGRERERHLIKHGPDSKPTPRPKRQRPSAPTSNTQPQGQPATEVPTLAAFAPRYIEGYARANREKPSSIDSKESILRNHLIPAFGDTRLDELVQEDVQLLKAKMSELSNKTVNNTLTVLNTLLKCAVEWDVIAEHPVKIRLLKVTQPRVVFYDFEDFERLVTAAGKHDDRALLVVLLGGEAGLRRGEIMALEWTRVDFRRRQLTIDQAEWKGHVGLPKGNKIRVIPMTSRLCAALQAHRHLRGSRVLVRDDGQTATAKVIEKWLHAAQRIASLPDKGPHTLRHSFCSHLAMRGVPARAIQELAGHVNLSTTQRYMHLSPAALDRAIRALEEPPPTPARSSNE